MVAYNVGVTRQKEEKVLTFQTNGLPEELTADFVYDIVVPGDFIQRVNSARIANPNFRLSQQSLIENLFPEIKNANEEHGKLATEDTTASELFRMINDIKGYKRAAADANAFGDVESEQLFMLGAERLESQLRGRQEEGAAGLEQLTQGVGR